MPIALSAGVVVLSDRERVGQELAALVVEIAAEEMRQRAAKKAMAEKLGGLYTRQTELADALLHWTRGGQLPLEGLTEPQRAEEPPPTGAAPSKGHAIWCTDCGATSRCFCGKDVEDPEPHSCGACRLPTAVVMPDEPEADQATGEVDNVPLGDAAEAAALGAASRSPEVPEDAEVGR